MLRAILERERTAQPVSSILWERRLTYPLAIVKIIQRDALGCSTPVRVGHNSDRRHPKSVTYATQGKKP